MAEHVPTTPAHIHHPLRRALAVLCTARHRHGDAAALAACRRAGRLREPWEARLSALGRRAAIGTLFAGGASAAGITAGVAASVAPDADAELIAACAAFDVVERKVQAVSGAGTGWQEEQEEQLRELLREQQEPILHRICSLPPCTTLAGASALAASLHLWEAGELDLQDDPDGFTNDRLLSALLRGLVGRADT